MNAYSERWVRRGFPWVYPKEVISEGKARPGERLLIKTKGGDVLGRGIYDRGWLRARIFRHDDGPLDQPWLDEVLDRAAALRDRLIDPETTGFRLVNAENDGLPGIRVDWWGSCAVIVLDSPTLGSLVPGIVAWLESRCTPRAIWLCYRTDPRDEQVDDPSPAPGLIAGRRPTGDVLVRERGVKVRVRPWEGPDVGLYADMRDVRAWLEPHWGGRSVLNTFAYTGMFSVVAALGGAMEVVSVDLSERYLDRAEANFEANELDPGAYEFVAMDTFKALDRFRRQGRSFDLVVLDPPSFSHSDAGVWSAEKDYPRLVAAACRVLAPEGLLVAASNQGELSPRKFNGLVEDGMRKAGRRGQSIYRGGQAPDFPSASWFPEGRYLKVGVWRLL